MDLLLEPRVCVTALAEMDRRCEIAISQGSNAVSLSESKPQAFFLSVLLLYFFADITLQFTFIGI